MKLLVLDNHRFPGREGRDEIETSWRKTLVFLGDFMVRGSIRGLYLCKL